MDRTALTWRPLSGAVLFCLLLASAALAADKEFGGIGAQVVPVATGQVVVLQLVSGSPAQKAGLQPGDLIVGIDGTTLAGLDFETVTRQHLWGFVGEPVHIAWLRPGEETLREADLVRVRIDPDALRRPGIRMIEPEP